MSFKEPIYNDSSNSLTIKEQIPIYFDSPKAISETKKLNIVSLFSGCGGMDLGFEGGFSVYKTCIPTDSDFIQAHIDGDRVLLKPTVFQTVFANDILKEAYTAWSHYFKKLGYSNQIFKQESIVDLVKMHKMGANVFPTHVDIVTGGFPCQDFSVSGKRKGLDSHKDHTGKIIQEETEKNESRGQLYSWMKEVVSITKPKIFIAENVKGLVNLADVKEIIQKDFATADGDGYIVLDPQVLHAANYGVPQSRERVIFIGIRKSALKKSVLSDLSKEVIPEHLSPYPIPTHKYTIDSKGKLPAVKLIDIFSTLDEPALSNDLAQQYYSRAKFMGKHCQGQKEINIEGIGPTIRSEHHGNIEYRRLSKEHGGIMDSELEAGLLERRLTPRECAMIQTFPLDYDFVIPNPNRKNSFTLSPSSAYKVIGNAVPPLLAYHIAKRDRKSVV